MYFDLHCHPSFKTLLNAELPQDRKHDCWKTLNFKVDDIISIDDLSILDSQSSLKQLVNGNVKVAVVCLYGLENGFARAGIIKKIAALSRHVDLDFIKKVARSKIGYHDLMWADFDHLMRSDNVTPEHSFKLIRSFSEIDTSKLNVILAVEGGHNFYDSGQQMIDIDEVLERLKYFKSPNTERLLYITFTHLTRQELCNHAYGMKLISDDSFAPNANGISTAGKKFIRTALDDHIGQRIHIDIKHMSIIARREFYAIRKKEFPTAPIIASHMGVAGVSWNNKPVRRYKKVDKHNCVKVFYNEVPGALDTSFNPWSINLYDEDIKEIVDSDGIIGLSLDQRILGCADASPEYISLKEFKAAEYKSQGRKTDRRDIPIYTIELRKKWHLRFLCNNLVHIIKAAGHKGWDHVCIGSDYDGLINAIDYCKNASEYNNLFAGMVEQLPIVAKAAGIDLKPADVQKRVRQFIFENPMKFLEKYFNVSSI